MTAAPESEDSLPSREREPQWGTLSRSEKIYREFLSRRESGENVDPDEYIHQYPDLEDVLQMLFKRVMRRESVDPDLRALDTAKIPHTIGDFEIIREIGKGGMGTVYEAEQISLHRRVALKVLPSHLSFSVEAIKKFRREAEAGGRQSHPGIVTVHAVGDHEGTHYIAQELVKGSYTLADRLEAYRREGELPQGYFREVALLVAQLSDALSHSHESGVIHRDVKPSNILLTGEGTPKIGDFGLAKIEDALALSRTGDFSGTPYYMSPEQAASRRIGIDHRTDIFSLGVTLYEMLTLDRPFTGDTSHEVLRKILLIDPVDPHRANSRVPRDLSIICLKTIEKIPDRRYQTMS